MAKDFNALTLAHKCFHKHVKSGSICIDATAGRGRDTALLCELVGDSGKVLAFDIQQDALDSTQRLLNDRQLAHRATLILDSHSNMESYAEPDTVDLIAFNLGWLPGGDHTVFTNANTSLAAIQAGMRLLKPGGCMSICIYYGRECGFAERDALLDFLPTLDSSKYTVLICSFANRPNNPPIPVFIFRDA